MNATYNFVQEQIGEDSHVKLVAQQYYYGTVKPSEEETLLHKRRMHGQWWMEVHAMKGKQLIIPPKWKARPEALFLEGAVVLVGDS